MLRAMDSAVAGLRAHQNKLDVIGNNIANVNTNGFKSQNYTFKDAMYETSSTSSGGEATANGTATIGGSNPAQYGFGSMTGAITTDMSSSTPTYVGGFNANINGSGFFITKSANTDTALGTAAADRSKAIKAAKFSYTRVGQFSIDANGYMVDSNKNFVYGFRPQGDVQNPTSYDTGTLYALRAPSASTGANFTGAAMQLKSVQIDNDGVVKGTVTDDKGEAVSIVIGKVAIASFQNQEGLLKAGNNTFTASANDNTGTVTATEPGGATPSLMSGYLEASNVDLAKEFSEMITTERGFQANAKLITVSDEVLQELVNMKR
ncbi:MAG: flagellar hook-basal body complex protein [Eubacterium sp.]|nr:flagellar hook-basal body complex protein [Eubacterium sp.]